MSNQRYMMRGVSASKEDVHNAIKNIDKGIFPKAFCKIIPDLLGGDEEYCNIMHADGAGTKSSLAYLYWKEPGDLGVWKGIAQDALIMNIDDLLCVGATDNILVSSTIGRNKLLIPGEVMNIISTVYTEGIRCCIEYRLFDKKSKKSITGGIQNVRNRRIYRETQRSRCDAAGFKQIRISRL